MCLVTGVGKWLWLKLCWGIFCGKIEFQGFQGRVLTGWWVGVGDGFLYIWVYFFAVFGWGFWCLM